MWPGSAENSEESEEDSGYEEACFIADEYRQERLYEEEFCDPMLEDMFAAAKDDQAYQMVVEEVRRGLTKEALKLLPADHPARSMTQQWNEIGIMDRRNDGLLIFQGTRIIVPRAARKKIKDYLHLPHLGQQLTYQAAALRYWWPGGFKEEICKLVEACQTCAVYSPSRQREEEAEEMYQPRQPLDLVATDLFEIKGVHYLIVLDVFSGFPWVKNMGKSPKTNKVTEALNEIFLSYQSVLCQCLVISCVSGLFLVFCTLLSFH